MITKPKIYNKPDATLVALRLARDVGYQKVTRDALAYAVGCSTGQISNMFGTMNDLRRAIISASIHHKDLVVLAQGLAAQDSKAKNAPDELKRAALEGLMR